jgi:uncharacterized protein involved in outer membrane biogenesis
MKALRIILAVLGGAILLFVIVAIILVARFDPNDYKDEITAYVQERTGRTLTIDENIELSLFPWFAVETGGVTLSDDPAFGDRNFLTIDELSARVRVWPLLRRHVEIGRVILDGVELNLGFDAGGKGNWSSLLRTSATRTPEAEPSTPPDRPSWEQLAVEGIELRNARILWHEPNDEVRYIVRDLELRSGPIHDNDPVEFGLRLTLRDVPSQATADIELESTASIEPAPSLGDTRAAVNIFDARQQARASVMLTLDSGNYDNGRVSLGPAEITASLHEPPVGPDTLDLSATLDGLDLDTGSGRLAIDGLRTRVGELEANWRLNGNAMLTEPRVSGAVTLEDGTLAAVFATLGIEPPAPGDSDLGPLAADANFTLALAPMALSVDRFALTALGIEARGSASFGTDQSVTARVDLPSFRPTEPLLELLAPRLPDGVELGAVRRASLSAKLSLPPGADELEIDELAVALDDARLGGRLTLTGLKTPSRIQGSVTASDIDNRLLSALLGPWAPAQLVDTDVGTFRLATDFDYVPKSRVAVFDRMALTAYGLSGDGQLTLVNAQDGLALSGQASLAEFSPRALLARFGLPVPQSADPTAFGSAELAASFETKGASGSFRDIVVELDDSRITGEFSVDDFADPSYHFVLRADRIDADRYLPPSGPSAEDAGSADERALGDVRLAAGPLSATVASGTASVGELTLGGMRFEQLSTGLSVGAGRLALSSVRTQLYGGDFSGSFSVDASAATPTVHLTGAADNLSLGPLLMAMLGGSYLSGKGRFDLDLTGQGSTISETLQTAAGKLNFALHDGQIDSFNLDRAFCAAFNTADGLAPPASAPDVTRYSEMSGEATVSEGIASTPKLVARTEHFEGTGSGRLRLVDNRVDYNLRVKLTSAIPIAGCDKINTQVGNSFPFTLNGILGQAKPMPDLQQYIRDRARDAVRDRVGDAIRGLFE